ncbi:hypothetical protein B0H19DRAFT_1079895 [Mycena capillaripes]|nr:hypothetical protein B0H19DRAFT_1079895 [Mycena capillaripes]
MLNQCHRQILLAAGLRSGEKKRNHQRRMAGARVERAILQQSSPGATTAEKRRCAPHATEACARRGWEVLIQTGRLRVKSPPPPPVVPQFQRKRQLWEEASRNKKEKQKEKEKEI